MESFNHTGGSAAEARDLDAVARFYVKCALWLGVHDPNFVEAYFGPAAVREEALMVTVPPDRVAGYAADLLATLDRIDPDRLEGAGRMRHACLQGMVRALEARAGLLAGMTISFDAEAEALFGVAAPEDEPAWYEGLHAALDADLPGTGDLPGRYRTFMDSFIIPPDRLEQVFAAAFAESRRRTAEHLPLPAGVRLEAAYVTGEPWEACNRYLGDGTSLVRVSADLPVTIDRPLTYACREGYPGHHTMWAIREAGLVRARGWIEHSVVPLASPLTTVAEGAARLGEEMIFPGSERVGFLEEVLFPLAGFDPSDAALVDAVSTAAMDLVLLGNARVARGLIGGALSREEAYGFLQDVLLLDPETAKAHLRFIEEFRAYPVALSEGYRLVRDYVGSGTDRWERFAHVLTEPVLPGDLTSSGSPG
ncbi:hypothetical protein HL657_03710 [Methanoculleus sp. YWC-01]|jgi:hypothetical protein|uniref:DUF885 domain-containing protein n=1 Tax=Methanoculleus nereidis TaxID=2735141 RepID=A0ABU3Z0E8_9EURY|nr:hypothetical protein [Methanoculleus sp. YWC-01]MCK9298417.1 hypothetical protein [Methanoculleus sp.]MDV4342291.1 hypothetical protein [Methanoculleus sp. YWC-01]PKL57098.1 MAG: hypothetical protein CVV35_01770 [Methanomicrobiales archaeon HGW-Methanomicrobiales-6]